MRLIGNVIWFLFGGALMGLGWWLVGVLACLTIVGIPWAKACFVIGQLSFFPFGRMAVNRRELGLEEDLGTGALGVLGNVVWFVFAGLWLAVGHLGWALLCFLSIVGIPFGLQHLKLAVISAAPIGLMVVPVEVAEAAR